MINGLGVVGWGVGGIEAEAGMLGQPVYFLTPEVVGVHLTGQLARRRDRDRSRAAHHADAARAESRRQICRVLRRRRGLAAGAGSRDDRQHGAGVRRDDGIFPGRSGIGQLSARDRSHRRTMRRVRKLFPRAKNVRHAAQRRNRLQRRSRTGSRRRAAGRGRTEASAGSHQSSGAWRRLSLASCKNRSRTAVTAKQTAILARNHLGAI